MYLLTVNSSTKEVDDSRHTRYNTYNFSSFYAETLIKGIINKDPFSMVGQFNLSEINISCSIHYCWVENLFRKERKI